MIEAVTEGVWISTDETEAAEQLESVVCARPDLASRVAELQKDRGSASEVLRGLVEDGTFFLLTDEEAQALEDEARLAEAWVGATHRSDGSDASDGL